MKKNKVKNKGRPPNKKVKNKALEKAIKEVGGIVNLSLDLGISYPGISRWLYTDIPVPAHHVPAIVRATKGKVTAKELRPDIDWEMPDGR